LGLPIYKLFWFKRNIIFSASAAVEFCVAIYLQRHAFSLIGGDSPSPMLAHAVLYWHATNCSVSRSHTQKKHLETLFCFCYPLTFVWGERRDVVASLWAPWQISEI